MSVALLIWLATVELAVEGWYRLHESRAAKSPEWTLSWPPQEPGFQEVKVPDASREMLKYDEGHSGSWTTDSGRTWFMYYFKWLPGRIALSSAKGHTPDICLTASGKQLRQLDDNRCPIRIGSLIFPFKRYEFDENGRTMYVFHCLWEENAPGDYFAANPSSRSMDLRLKGVLEGRRNLGQRSIEIFVSGLEDAQAAQAAVETQLRKMIQVHSSSLSGG